MEDDVAEPAVALGEAEDECPDDSLSSLFADVAGCESAGEVLLVPNTPA